MADSYAPGAVRQAGPVRARIVCPLRKGWRQCHAVETILTIERRISENLGGKLGTELAPAPTPDAKWMEPTTRNIDATISKKVTREGMDRSSCGDRWTEGPIGNASRLPT
jgi:hypothetical protein